MKVAVILLIIFCGVVGVMLILMVEARNRKILRYRDKLDLMGYEREWRESSTDFEVMTGRWDK